MDSRTISLLLLLAYPAVSPATQEQTVDLDNLTVSATTLSPLPQDNGHLHADDLQHHRYHSSDTASMLNSLAGIATYQGSGTASLPVIRGLADDRLRIKVDGMDLISACANHMNPPLSYLSPSRVAELTVYSGITPVSLGGDSIGGTIIANSAPPQFAANNEALLTKGEIGGYYRSNGHARGANISTTIASEHISLRYSGETNKAHNYNAGGGFKAAGPAAVGRGWLDADEVGSSAYETQNHAVDFGVKLDNHLLQLTFVHQNIPYQGWPNQRMDMTENRSNQINLAYNGNFDWGSLETRFYHEKIRHKMQLGRDRQFFYGEARGMPMETKASTYGVSVNVEINANQRDTFRVGTDLQRYRLDDFRKPSGGMIMAPNTFWHINNGQRDRYGVFAEWEAMWSNQWSTLVGIRHETVQMDTGNVQGYNPMFAADANAFNRRNHNKTDSNLDLTLMARYTPSAMASYEFGYAQKSRSPNLYERYSWSRHGMAMRMSNLVGDGNGYVGNINVEPEIAHTISFTADWHDAKQQDWRLNITPYISYVDDYIDALRCNGEIAGMMGAVCTDANLSRRNDFVYLQYDNVSARLMGIDINVNKQLPSTEILGHLSGSAAISYVHGENRDSGDTLYNMMPLNAICARDQSKGRWHNRVEWELVAAKQQLNYERNEIATEGYGLLHLRTRYDWQQFSLELGVENVLDKLYSSPLSGAYTGQGATMAPAVPWGVTVPGMGRSVYAGFNYKF